MTQSNARPLQEMRRSRDILPEMCKKHNYAKDVSFLISIEVFLLTVRFCTYGGGTISEEDQTQCSDRETVREKTEPIFDRTVAAGITTE